MALKPVNTNTGDATFKKSSEMTEGEVLKGFVTKISSKPSEMYEGQTMTTIFVKQEDGVTVGLSVSGSLKYDIADGRIKEGLYTEITANGKQKKKNKKGISYTAGSFTVLQDDERSVEDAKFADLGSDTPPAKKGAAAINQASALRAAANKN